MIEEVEKTVDKLRIEKGLINTQLAKELNMSRQSLNQFVKRNPESIKLNVFQRILDKLGHELIIIKKSK